MELKYEPLTLAVLATFVVILLGSGFLAYVFRDPPKPPVTTAPSAPNVTAPAR